MANNLGKKINFTKKIIVYHHRIFLLFHHCDFLIKFNSTLDGKDKRKEKKKDCAFNFIKTFMSYSNIHTHLSHKVIYLIKIYIKISSLQSIKVYTILTNSYLKIIIIFINYFISPNKIKAPEN
ncbi:hypothetical protein Pfo_021942 [Paulownia fortunei]|nr:hypothetical protein Pfo_021942 [Paulownia fortunei]